MAAATWRVGANQRRRDFRCYTPWFRMRFQLFAVPLNAGNTDI